MSIAQAGVYWPFKTLLQGAGISLTEDATTIRITNTGGTGGGSGDMLQSEYATNGVSGIVDKAVVAEGLVSGATVPLALQANAVPWTGITGVPTSFPSDWSILTNKPLVFPPSPHAPTHLPGASDPISLATVQQPGFLTQVSGNTTDFVDGTNKCQPLAPAIQAAAPPVIWSVRLRSYNAIGNPNFEVTQRHCGQAVGLPASPANVFIEDRWYVGDTAGITTIGQRIGLPFYNSVLVPGTNFPISNAFLRVTLNATKTVLAASDWVGFGQTIEGPPFRELSTDVHSFSLLVRSSVANLVFCVSLRDPGATRSIVYLCPLGAANTLTLITLPNIPVWPSSGQFNSGVGSAGYALNITLATGSNFWIPSGTQGTWVNGNFIGAAGQSNFLFGPVGSTFDLAFVQHEPGPACTTLMDKPFQQNFLECQRYYCKSLPYGIPAGANNGNGTHLCVYALNYLWMATGNQFPRRMAKTPAVTVYHPNGTSNFIFSYFSSAGNASAVVSSVAAVADGGFSDINTSGYRGSNPSNSGQDWPGCPGSYHFVADTGW